LVNTPAADEATAFDRPIATIGVMLELQSAFTLRRGDRARAVAPRDASSTASPTPVRSLFSEDFA